MSRLSGLGTLVNELNPLAVGQAMEQFNRVAAQRQQEEIYTNLLRQHNSDIQQNPEYRRNFNSLAKRNPNALMSARNLSQIRAQVGAVRQNLQMATELEQRVDAFAASPQGRAIGFNAEFEKQRLRDISKMIRENPEVGNQALFQQMNILSSAMQTGQQEDVVQSFMRENRGRPISDVLTQLRDLPIPRKLKDQVQISLLREEQLRSSQASAAAKAATAGMSPALREALQSVDRVTDEKSLLEEERRIISLAKVPFNQGGFKDKGEFDTAVSQIRDRRAALKGIETEAKADLAFAENVDFLVKDMADKGFTPDQVAEYVADDDDNANFFEKQTGFKTIGEARVGINNFDQILKGRSEEAEVITQDNDQNAISFAEGGSLFSAFPSTKVRGELVVPTKDAGLSVLAKVPPAAQLDTAGGFFGGISKDPRGLPGFSELSVVATRVPDEFGQGKDVFLPALSSADGTKRYAFAYPDRNAAPVVYEIPVRDGELIQDERRPIQLSTLARDIIEDVDPDKDDNRLGIILKSMGTFRDALKRDAKNASPQNKAALEGMVDNVRNTIETISIFKGESGFGELTGDEADSSRREPLNVQRDSVEGRRLATEALTSFIFNYMRYMAIQGNVLTGIEPIDVTVEKGRQLEEQRNQGTINAPSGGPSIVPPSGGGDSLIIPPSLNGGGEVQEDFGFDDIEF